MNETATQNVVKEFFYGNLITYSAKIGKIETHLGLRNAEKVGWQHGTDYKCLADLSVEWDNTHLGSAGRGPYIEWHPAYFHVSDLDFGGLFKDMHKYAEAMAAVLTHMKHSPDVNDVRRCFYSLEDQVRADFDKPEFKEHFKRK
jgi:hypothetical protein